MDIAKSLNKPVEGLETAEDQVKAFDKVPDSTEARGIMEFLDDLPKQRAILQQLINAYKKQDVAALHELVIATEDFDRDAMLYQRNRNWIPVMEKAMKKDLVLFAVGAGHLGGDQGAGAAPEKGYKVEAVTQ